MYNLFGHRWHSKQSKVQGIIRGTLKRDGRSSRMPQQKFESTELGSLGSTDYPLRVVLSGSSLLLEQAKASPLTGAYFSTHPLYLHFTRTFHDHRNWLKLSKPIFYFQFFPYPRAHLC